MAIGFDELLNNLPKYKAFLRPDEKIVFPRLEAKRRAVNKEKRTRVQFDCTPETYAAFHTQLRRYRELVENITIAEQIMCELLAAVKDETILGLAGEREDSDFEMGKDSHAGE